MKTKENKTRIIHNPENHSVTHTANSEVNRGEILFFTIFIPDHNRLMIQFYYHVSNPLSRNIFVGMVISYADTEKYFLFFRKKFLGGEKSY